MRCILRILVSAAAVIACVTDCNAHAESSGASVHRSPHTEHSAWLVGLKGVYVRAFNSHERALDGGGVAVFAETTIIPGWLETELNVAVVDFEEGAAVVPDDLLFKKPFHIGSFCPYVGVGPSMTIVLEAGGEVLFGFVAAVGAYVWLHDHVGIDVELDYGLVAEDGVEHELTVAAGPTLRF